jgi:hypothetical protein
MLSRCWRKHSVSQTIGETMKPNKIRGWLKSRIVAAALLGFLPIKLADWLIQRRGLRHD